ncbi:hypothetical protein H6776_00195 [Candidatus Nomurabacteria bacterium]|nr:hypothetical protein [Candidatus Nomurabacteria bacterium]
MPGVGSYNFVHVKEVRDGVVILKDGGLRGILMVTSMNLALKSAEEQEATIFQFQNFLNTLDFDTQILVQSRRMDIRPYIKTLQDRMLQQKEELLRLQTRMYIEYVQWFAQEYDIMKKHFFVVVPYSADAGQTRKKSFIDKLFGGASGKKKVLSKKGSSTQNTSADDEDFEQKRSQLEQRMAVVRQGLMSLGLVVGYLDTEELIDMYYSLYNPGDTQKALTGALSLE